MTGLLLVDDLVTGPRYESCEDGASCVSEGVGLGEVTRGVAGMAGLVRKAMANGNGGRGGERSAPTTVRRKETEPKGQREEWRWLSIRERRVVIVPRSPNRQTREA